MARISAARLAIFEVLARVAEGGYASDSLRERTQRLASRDAGLASQIVFGCLRYQAQLDYLISLYSGRSARELDQPVLIALRTAIYQVRYLERVPPHAAVHESVEYVKYRKRSAAGFTNAVLRKVNRQPVVWPDVATRLSCPAWLLDRWTEHFGKEQAVKIAESALQEPTAYVRVRAGSEPPKGCVLASTDVPGCFQVLSGTPLGARQHDISSQAILPLLDLRPGNRYLDLCAAPGNKTLQALETPGVQAIACDVSEKRIREIPPVCDRVVLDATQTHPFGRLFDRIFVDAPCSGTGTLGRNPEIKWRVQPTELARFAERQRQIISRAVQSLAPEGVLLYATCSLEWEENESIIQAVQQEYPALRLLKELWRLPGREPGDGFYSAVLKLGSMLG